MAQVTISLPDTTPLTEREKLIQQLSMVLLGGAVVSGILAALLVLLSVIGGTGDGALFNSLSGIVLANTPFAADTAVVASIMLLLFNAGLMLVLVVGIRAQEIWAIPGVWLVVIMNVLLLVSQGFLPALLTIVPAALVGMMMFRDISAFRLNPVMLKELRGRMRGVRAFIIITVYLGLMSGFTVLLYLIQSQISVTSGTAVTGELGRVLFVGVVAIELVLIVFIAPSFTAGAITGERERKTYDLLQTTLLPVSAFIVGKLESSLSYILLLLLAAIPLQSIAFLFGGVSETELILAFILLMVTAITLGAAGLFFSSLTDRTLAASIRAYTSAMVVAFGVPILFSLFLSVYNSILSGVSSGIGDPITEALFTYIGLIAASINPVTAALFSQRMLIDHQEIFFTTATLRDGSQLPLIAPWVLFSITYLILSAVLMLYTMRRVRMTEE